MNLVTEIIILNNTNTSSIILKIPEHKILTNVLIICVYKFIQSSCVSMYTSIMFQNLSSSHYIITESI